MSFFSHKTRIKNKISIFLALKYIAVLFVGIWKRIDNLFSRMMVALVILLLVFAYTPSVNSARNTSQITIGTTQTINVYPGKISKSQWAGYENVLSPDLGNDALYQDFLETNAAYVPRNGELVEINKPVTTPARTRETSAPAETQTTESFDTSTTTEDSLDVEAESEPLDTIQEEVVTAIPDTGLGIEEVSVESVENAEEESEPETEPPAEESPAEEPVAEESPAEEPVAEDSLAEDSPVVFKKATDSVFAFFSTVTKLFPFANQATTTPTEVVSEPVSPEAEEVVQEPVTEEFVETTAETTATTSSLDMSQQTPTEVTTPTTTSNIATSTNAFLDVSEGLVDVVPESSSPDSFRVSLTDFSTIPLERGQFIKNMQLRASVGGLYTEQASSTIPQLDFVMHTPSSTQTIGTILLDGEVSNAVNGGYFLFSFPQLDTLDGLQNLSIEVVFNGSIENLEGLFLDALWLEIETETITRDDLYERSGVSLLGHLDNPMKYNFISLKRDFNRFETPVFNLRYVSQRNKAVQAVRDFFGRNMVEIQKTEVKHKGSGLLGVVPDVNVTKDGLISISIPEDQQKKMKPGTYTIEVITDEGGVITTDSFDFQWGILSINSDKTHYVYNDVAEISLGALTPNGNTLCNADLRLYVIDPKENITQADVSESGVCKGNNVIDEPDYTSTVVLDQVGTYELYLERRGEDGSVIGHTSNTFYSSLAQDLSIKRVGPTRIFPPSPYPMTLTVYSEHGFSGTLTERVPNTFDISKTSARITEVGNEFELVWDVDLLAGKSKSVSYIFDAPDLSPYLYELGPAHLEGSVTKKAKVKGIATSTASSTIQTVPEEVFEQPEAPQLDTPQVSQIKPQSQYEFEEHRQWQIASDATGNMILFWDDGASIPTNWSCLSCGSGTFYQKFAVGSSTYNTTGGAVDHTPTATGGVDQNTTAATESGAGTIAASGHGHTYTPSITPASNLPLYRELRVIQYTASAGEPATIPAGAIGVFDAAVPVGWTQYSAQDGYYIRGGDTPGTVAGSNTHIHTISGTTGGSTGGTELNRSGGVQAAGAADGHTHTVGTTTELVSNEPPFIEVILGKIDSTAAPGLGLITMWTDEVPSGWLDVSSGGVDPFNNKFLKASTSYSVIGGASTHVHGDINDILSSVPSATTNGRTGSSGSIGNHEHTVDVTSFSTDSNLPPYTTVVFGRKQANNPVYEQLEYRWYVNEDAQTPTDPWPVGVTDLVENEAITSTSTVPTSGDVLRLRMSAELSNATSTAGAFFKLQYAAANTCSAVGQWSDVGDIASSTVWRGYVNAGVTDGSTLSSTLLASSTVTETYQENGIATSSPNEIPPEDVGEWDFVLEHNDAVAGTNYCFRMAESDGTAFATYTNYPQLVTNQAPIAPALNTLFNNEKSTSTDSLFTFAALDPEGQDIHYQIQIDNDYAFGSTLEDKNTISNADQFENLVLPSNGAPFNSGQLMQFDPSVAMIPGTTYWWRVRSTDPKDQGAEPNGSDQWGAWATPQSFTLDLSRLASAWFQTTQEQFDTNTLDGVVTASGAANLIVSSSTGTMISDAIDFDDGTVGTSWGSFEFNNSGTAVTHTLQYYTDGAVWEDIPDSVLAGNSSGLGPSPVNLLNLDTVMYNDIRIVANYSTGGSPSVLNWGIYWGNKVDTPSITKLFPDEKTGTTTPLFEFTAVDPQSQDLTYQISWSTDKAFASSTTRTSDDGGGGFVNIDFGVDNDPFISGHSIQYQMQAADTLTSGTTYWWRVRAKDSGAGGDNSYSLWTDEYSFTVDTTVAVSTWFQTTQEQFDANILSGTYSLGGGVAVASTAVEALIVYGEGVASTPRYRQWDGTVWGIEGSLSSIDSVLSWAKVKAATTREEYIAVTVGADADVNAQIFSTGQWGNLHEMTTGMEDTNARGFDVAYETVSGDAIVAYCDGDADPSYYIWDGSSWTSGGTINLASANACRWIQMAADPTSDEIIILAADSLGSQYEAQVWNGSTWGNSTSQGSIVDEDHEGMAIVYEESGGQALILTSDGNQARFEWNSWNGTTWGSAATQGIGNDFEWGTLVSDVGSDELALCYIDEDADIGMIRWTGSAWAGQTELTADGRTKVSPGFSCVFEDGINDGNIMTAYTDSTQTNYSFWNGSTWSTAAQLDSLTQTVTSELQRTGNGTILGVFFDDVNDTLMSSSWDGAIWATSTILESDASVGSPPYGRPYSIGVRNHGDVEATIVSQAINFTDGVGPHWEEMSWNDSAPVGTEVILYSVQYNNGSEWAFIPDADIPGNEVGTSTSPIDLSGLSKSTYNMIRPYASLSCDGSGNCPTLFDWTVQWAEGLSVSGTLQGYDQGTNITGTQIRIAINGVVQSGKSDVSAAGAWSIANVTVFPGDVVAAFAFNEADESEAVGVTRYDGVGNITGFQLFERHLTLGSDDATSTPLTNMDIGLYDVTNTEDVFFDVTGDVLTTCGDAGCFDAEIYINASTTYNPGGNVNAHDIEINGTLISTSTLYVSGSWDNNATTTLTGATVVMVATSTTESIDTTGAFVPTFGSLEFGTTTGAATWTLSSPLDVDGNLLVTRGVLARGNTAITIAGDLTNGANGLWTGIGSTIFDGAVSTMWSDTNAILQNIGNAVIDGTSKIVTLTGNVAAHSIAIGADDSLDVSVASYDLTTYGDFINNNNFVARAGVVLFAATTTGQVITAGSNAFYDMQFTGGGGSWSFTESTLTIDHDFTIATGTVTMSTATTTIGGSFSSAGGLFAHNNSIIDFDGPGPETITTSGTVFTNAFYDITFSGSGSWTVLDTNATTSNDIRITGGTLVTSSGELVIGGSLLNTTGSITASAGTVKMDSAVAESITLSGSSLFNLLVAGTGTFTITDTNASVSGDLTVAAGTLVLPTGTFSVGGSLLNFTTITPQTGTVLFNSTDTGETVDLGSSSLYNMNFDAAGGGWTITQNATTTNNFTLATSYDFTLASGQILSVGGMFTNNVGGASTTWSGSTLVLDNASKYEINTKTTPTEQYENLIIGNNSDISSWNSAATSTVVAADSSLYSQDNAGVDGNLFIFGDYHISTTTEYWSYATDFDGEILGLPRKVDVLVSDGSLVTVDGGTLHIIGEE